MDNAPEDLHRTGMRMGYWFLTQAMNRADTIIALMPMFTISDSDVRMRAIKRYGLRSVTVLPRKTFDWTRIQTVVLHLQKNYKGKTIFEAYDCLNDHATLHLDM